MSTVRRTRFLIRAMVAAMALAIAAIGPASAETLVDTDVLSMDQAIKGRACYVLCGAANPTTLEWKLLDGPAPRVRQVTGYGSLGITGPNPAQICARGRSVFRTKGGSRLATRQGSGVNVVCLPANTVAGGRGGTPIDNYHPVRATNLYSVTVTLQVGPTAQGPWSKVRSVTCVWKTTDCNAV